MTDWVETEGPFNWFQCQIPADWMPRSDTGALHLYAVDGPLSISFNAFWHPVKSVAPAQLLDPHTIFPAAFGLRKLAPLHLSQAASYGVEGYSAVGESPGIIKQIFTPRRKHHWQAWALRRQFVCVICKIERTDEGPLTSEQKELVRRILESVSFTENPTLPPEEFTRCLLSRSRRRFGEPGKSTGPLSLAIGDVRVSLSSYYRNYASGLFSLDEVTESVLGTLDRLLNWDGVDFEAQLDQVRHRIMPILAPEAQFQQSLSSFVSAPWIAGLRIMYVVDEHDAYWYIRDTLFEGWDLTPDEIHELAIENLNTYFQDDPVSIATVDGGSGSSLLMPEQPDAYNSVRLLTRDFHRRLQRQLGTEFAIGIPNRDFFVAVSLQNAEILDRIRGKVADDFRTMDHPLTDRMLVVSTDGVSEYCEQG